MTDKRNVDTILEDWNELPKLDDLNEPVNEAMHPMQAIQAIQTALNSMESHVSSARIWYRDYGKKTGSMAGVHSDEQMLSELVKESEGMMRQAKKIHGQAVKAVKAHEALARSGK